MFTLCHGQATVERGFSVYKELLVENQQQTSLTSQRLIGDYVSDFSKPISEIPLTNGMLKSCRLAHSRYVAALERKEMQQFHRRKASNGNLSLKRLLK